MNMKATTGDDTGYVDAAQRVKNFRLQLCDLALDAREIAPQISDKRTRALLEATAEVLRGIRAAFERTEREELPYFKPWGNGKAA